MDTALETQVQREVITDRLRAAMPGSFAAGQIPVEVVMKALAPLVDEIADLRVRVAALEAPQVPEVLEAK